MDFMNDLPLPQSIIFQLRICGHFLHYNMGGKAGRKRILVTLLGHQKILQRELQKILEIQSGSLSEMIIKLEADGLIEKVKCDHDGRNLVLQLTEKGTVLAKRFKRDYDQQVEELLSCFSQEQLHQLHDLLGTMLSHWKAVEESWGDSMRSQVQDPQ